MRGCARSSSARTGTCGGRRRRTTSRCGRRRTSSVSSGLWRRRRRAATSRSISRLPPTQRGGQSPDRPPSSLRHLAAPSTEPSVPSCIRYRPCAAAFESKVHGLDTCSIVEIEVPRGLLLEPEPVVLRRLLKEVGRLLEHVVVRV